VFKQKAIEEALSLLKENGFAMPEPVKNSKSRTGSIAQLFGVKAKSVVCSSKKREVKATDKEE
jgi:hypothetical protein